MHSTLVSESSLHSPTNSPRRRGGRRANCNPQASGSGGVREKGEINHRITCLHVSAGETLVRDALPHLLHKRNQWKKNRKRNLWEKKTGSCRKLRKATKSRNLSETTEKDWKPESMGTYARRLETGIWGKLWKEPKYQNLSEAMERE